MSLKKQFPTADGWIHAKLSLQKGHDLTVDVLTQNWRGFFTPRSAEIGHVAINGRKAVVILRPGKLGCAACDRGDFQLGHADGCPNA